MRLTLHFSRAERHDTALPARASLVLDRGSVIVGRSSSTAMVNDWSLPDPRNRLSRRHCLIERCGRDYLLTDLSFNGVFINGATNKLGKGNSVVLKHGDSIDLVSYIAQVSIAEIGAVEPAESTEPATPAGKPAVITDLDQEALLREVFSLP